MAGAVVWLCGECGGADASSGRTGAREPPLYECGLEYPGLHADAGFTTDRAAGADPPAERPEQTGIEVDHVDVGDVTVQQLTTAKQQQPHALVSAGGGYTQRSSSLLIAKGLQQHQLNAHARSKTRYTKTHYIHGVYDVYHTCDTYLSNLA